MTLPLFRHGRAIPLPKLQDQPDDQDRQDQDAGLDLPGWVTHLLHRLGIAGYGRDLGQIRRVLVERGLAVPLGQPFRTTAAPLADELAPVAQRIRALLAERGAA